MTMSYAISIFKYHRNTMKKTIIGLFVVLNLHAQTYEALLELAINNNAQLQITGNQQEEKSLEGTITTRLKNPTLEVGVADFSSRRLLRENEIGWSVGLSQSLLLPSVKADKKKLTQSQVELAKQNYQLEKSMFIYRFNLNYLAYKEALQKELLQTESLAISKKILAVTQGRFSAGSIAKTELLQAQIEQSEALSYAKVLSLETLQQKNTLLRFANLEKNTELDAEHTFVQNSTVSTHPLLVLTQKKEEVSLAKLAVASHNIESIELFSEIEAEPDQDIFRVGISLALPIFNQRSEEKQLAKIAISNQKLALALGKKLLALELAQLQKEIVVQEVLKSNYEALILEEEQLLTMYQEGYAIAKVNLLKLNMLKKKLLDNRECLLEVTLAIEKNIIKINYLQGGQNE